MSNSEGVYDNHLSGKQSSVWGSTEGNIFKIDGIEEKEHVSISYKEVFKNVHRIFLNIRNECNSRKFLEDRNKLIKKSTMTKTMVYHFLINSSQLRDSRRICQQDEETSLPILQGRSQKKPWHCSEKTFKINCLNLEDS